MKYLIAFLLVSFAAPTMAHDWNRPYYQPYYTSPYYAPCHRHYPSYVPTYTPVYVPSPYYYGGAGPFFYFN
jgi:hypothetical protein